MRQHRAKDFAPRAWPTVGPDKRVFIECGFARYTATAEEAEEFARKLAAAAEEVRGAHDA